MKILVLINSNPECIQQFGVDMYNIGEEYEIDIFSIQALSYIAEQTFDIHYIYMYDFLYKKLEEDKENIMKQKTDIKLVFGNIKKIDEQFDLIMTCPDYCYASPEGETLDDLYLKEMQRLLVENNMPNTYFDEAYKLEDAIIFPTQQKLLKFLRRAIEDEIQRGTVKDNQ